MSQRRSRYILPDVSPNREKLSSTGLHRSFSAMMDNVIQDANYGVNIITEYPGFYRAMLDNKNLYSLFLNKIKTG